MSELARLEQFSASRKLRKTRSQAGWWYFAKKAIALFPGVRRARAASFLSAYYRQWEDSLSLARVSLNRAMLAGFRAWVPGRTRKIAARYRLDNHWQAEANRRARQFIFDPHELALFRISTDDEIDVCLRRFEWARMHKLLVPQYWQPDCRVAHKIDFYLHAMRHHLPIPALRAMVGNREVTILRPADSDKLICKPDNGHGGNAVFVLNLPPQAIGNESKLAEVLASEPRMAKGDWVVQDLVSVHRALADLAMRALPTIRMITMPNEQGDPEILVTYLRIAVDPDSVVDNFAAGGLMARIDPITGVMGNACIMTDLDDHAVHPLTGEAIAGVAIPYWQDACALVRRAHAEAFADYRIIGWDIAITRDGPMIIEGNAKPCPQGAQQVQRMGLGATRFGELIAWHLKDAAGRS